MMVQARLLPALLGVSMALSAWWAGADEPTATAPADGLVQRAVDCGEYWCYTPTKRAAAVLVVVHGSLGRDETGLEAARRFGRRWVAFAERHQLVMVAPAFAAPEYQAAYGGYRGLFGRDCAADAFLHEIVADAGQAVPEFDGRFYLYGHSAGGQFACRYVVTHPERVRAVVLSAPGRYAFPTKDAPWPYGMGRMKRDLRWGGGTPAQAVDYTPDPRGWERAAALPIAVVVGSKDLERQPKRPGHRGRTRVALAEAWTDDMQKLARRTHGHCGVSLRIVPNVAHSSAWLTPACQEAFDRFLEQ